MKIFSLSKAILLFALLGLSFLAMQSVSYAQNATPPADPDFTLDQISVEDIPDAYFKQSELFYKKCSNETYLKNYYSCECLAAIYFDRAVAEGIDLPFSAIIEDNKEECKDAVNAAGKAYGDCVSNPTSIPEHLTPDEYCQCFANGFAKLYGTAKGNIDQRQRMNIRARVGFICTNPEDAARLYPGAYRAMNK